MSSTWTMSGLDIRSTATGAGCFESTILVSMKLGHTTIGSIRINLNSKGLCSSSIRGIEMSPSMAREQAEVMMAFANGSQVQVSRLFEDTWHDTLHPEWNRRDCRYRVKPSAPVYVWIDVEAPGQMIAKTLPSDSPTEHMYCLALIGQEKL